MGELTAFMADMAEREQERICWDYYLARVHNMSYADWLASLDMKQHEASHKPHEKSMSQEEIIKQAMKIAAISRGEV